MFVFIIKRGWVGSKYHHSYLYLKNGIYYWSSPPQDGELKPNVVYCYSDMYKTLLQIAKLVNGNVNKHYVSHKLIKC